MNAATTTSTFTESAKPAMMSGPSRRSNHRLALQFPAQPQAQGNDGSIQHSSTTPPSPSKHRGGGAFYKFDRKLSISEKYTRATRRHVPFIVWMASITIFISVTYVRMRSYRALSRAVSRQGMLATEGRLRGSDSVPPPKLSAATGDETMTNAASPHRTALDREGNVGGENPELHLNGLRATDKDDNTINLAAQGNESIVSGEKDDKSVVATGSLIHVIETRFMQGQSNLIELGIARLALFESFCFPSILAQSNQDFIWIVRVDPNLHPGILDTLVQMLKDYQNFVLIGSNSNPEEFGRSGSPFQDFLQADSKTPGVKAKVHSGNISLVEEAFKKTANSAVLLETRLDADDGLHMDFVKTVQSEARISLYSDNGKDPKLWRLWCVHSNFEWHPLNPYPETPEVVASNETRPEGYLVMYADSGACVTPGLTFGYGNGANKTSLGLTHLRHDEIVKKIKSCNSTTGIEVGCVSRLKKLVPGAIRARTSTSAGMFNVVTGDKKIDEKHGLKRRTTNKRLIQQYFQQKELWKYLSMLFSVMADNAQLSRSILVERKREIAEENLKGQCTPGHSCKNRTKEVLGKIAS
ncbi:hypothetical protein ACHAWF_004822 [Thalassiosira exigua]